MNAPITLQLQHSVLTRKALPRITGGSSVFIHVWAEGVKKNIEGDRTPVIMVRAKGALEHALFVRDTRMKKSKILFRPNDRLPGFGGRVMSWVEVKAKNLWVTPYAHGMPEMPFLDFYNGVRKGDLVIPHIFVP